MEANRAERLEALLSLVVALLADERGISIDQVRQSLWPQKEAAQESRPQGPRLLRIEEVEHRTGLKTSTLYQYMLDGKFPRPVPLGNKSRGWIEAEVDAWIGMRIAERDT